ncbi:MAG: hypothetical protein R3B95_00410 [Nitrospirales bacterium]|nr:hypothetical protein [Nitrospirales bacterium]
MKITIEKKDYERFLGKDKVKLDILPKPMEVLGDEEDKEEAIMQFLPEVLAGKLKKMIPPEFEIVEIEMKLSIGGKPFGVGVDGEATVKFGPTRKP